MSKVCSERDRKCSLKSPIINFKSCVSQREREELRGSFPSFASDLIFDITKFLKETKILSAYILSLDDRGFPSFVGIISYYKRKKKLCHSLFFAVRFLSPFFKEKGRDDRNEDLFFIPFNERKRVFSSIFLFYRLPHSLKRLNETQTYRGKECLK